MNTVCKKEMLLAFNQYCNVIKPQKIADFGSFNSNGTYKSIVPEVWLYTGFDIVDGPNVDVVMVNEFDTGEQDEHYDIVISGSTLEHSPDPLRLIKEMVRVLKKDGVIIINAPQDKPEHGDRVYPDRHYKDYWRIMPQGMELLMKCAGIKVEATYPISSHNRTYTFGIGWK